MEEKKDTQGQLWEVFVQSKPGISYKHAGSVHAYDEKLAIENARDVYMRRNEGVSLWVVPSDQIIAVTDEETSYFFESANDKIYRHPTFYNLPEGIEHM